MVCISDFCIDDSLVIILGVIVNIVLVMVLVGQSRILNAQATHYRRTSQVILMEQKINELQLLSVDLVTKLTIEQHVDDNLFNDLTMKLYNMNYLFKEKVLKPVDFAIVFKGLWWATRFNEYYKTETYRNKYLDLQIIFNDFNNDVDAIIRMYSIPNPDFLDQVKTNGISKMWLNHAKNDWPGFQKSLRMYVWLMVHIKNYKHFKLTPLSKNNE